MNTQLHIHPTPEQAHRKLIDHFQQHLLAIIIAHQSGGCTQTLRAESARHCASLAQSPDDDLAHELAAPVCAILEDINCLTGHFERLQNQKILLQLDQALALISEQLTCLIQHRARTTRCPELLFEYLSGISDISPHTAQILHRYQLQFPEWSGHGRPATPGSILEDFARGAFHRVEILDDLAEAYPDQLKFAARQMHAWPMLAHRHTDSRRRFEQLAERLELGTDSCLDARPQADFQPDSPLVRYLAPYLRNLTHVHALLVQFPAEPADERRKNLAFWWRDVWQEFQVSEQILDAAVAIHELPPLTKSTAAEWAHKLIVPIILAADAPDWQNCIVPCLREFAARPDVTDSATFNSRLLAEVSLTLQHLSPPDAPMECAGPLCATAHSSLPGNHLRQVWETPA